MKIIADLHMHTAFSSHAFNTITEMIEQSKKVGLKAIAITDHGPAIPDSGHVWHFFNKGQIPKKVDDLVVLYGTEANVMDSEGTLDIPEKFLKNLDWVVASIHRELLLTFEQATSAWLNIAENPYVDMIGHCEQAEHFFDYEKVVKKFTENNKVVELNANSAYVRPSGKENMVTLALTCKKYNCKVAVNSDAHSIYRIADVQPILDLLDKIEYPKELIINITWENFVKELKIHNKEILNSIGE